MNLSPNMAVEPTRLWRWLTFGVIQNICLKKINFRKRIFHFSSNINTVHLARIYLQNDAARDPLVQRSAPAAQFEVAHLALDPARVEVTTTAHGFACSNFCQQRIAPQEQTLRGEWPQLAAFFA